MTRKDDMGKTELKPCKCNINGLLELYEVKRDLWFRVHPDRHYRMLRNFKFCPLCGKKLNRRTQ